MIWTGKQQAAEDKIYSVHRQSRKQHSAQTERKNVSTLMTTVDLFDLLLGFPKYQRRFGHGFIAKPYKR